MAEPAKPEDLKDNEDELKNPDGDTNQIPMYGGDPTYPHTDDSDDECEDESEYHNSVCQWSKSFYTKIYNALKDLEECNVKLSVPEFVFIGFQSSGKTSAVSQAAKLAVGVMKHGTASRCPTRFKLISNPKIKKLIITVNNKECRDERDLTNKTLEITKTYEDKDVFCKDIIEVKIISHQVPNLTFLDLPGNVV